MVVDGFLYLVSFVVLNLVVTEFFAIHFVFRPVH